MNVCGIHVKAKVEIEDALTICLSVRNNLDAAILETLSQATLAHLTRLFLSPWTKNITELARLMHSTMITMAMARASFKLCHLHSLL